MHARQFNPYMSRTNEQWVANSLNAQVNDGPGLDIFGEQFGMEVKFTLSNDNSGTIRYPQAWTVFDYQTRYKNGKETFWGFGWYSLSKPVRDIKLNDLENLEVLVIDRDLWVVPWEFLDDYKRHDTQGVSKITGIPWRNTLIYPKLKELPPIIKTSEVEKGRIHLTKGVNLNLF